MVIARDRDREDLCQYLDRPGDTPELEEKAYLEASVSHEDEAPLLAGEVYLHRDGAYIGKGRLRQVVPGDKVELGFGADDRLKVTRVPVRRRENDSGWLGATRTDQREFKTVVKSLHAQPVKLTVTEFLLLQSLAQRPGFVKSRDNLMDAAYDDQVYVDDRTIDSHIKRMRKKFREVDNEFDAIETLYGVGYRYREA